LEDFLNKISKKYGAGIMMPARDAAFGEMRPSFISTGSLRLDIALGGGKPAGVYRRRITSVWGEKSTGKTTLANSLIANAQKDGAICLYVSFEAKYDKVYAEMCGVDLDKLVILSPVPEDRKLGILSAEEVFRILEDAIRSNVLDGGVVVIDSLSAMSPKREIDGETGEMNPMLQAQLATIIMRKLPLLVVRHNIAMVMIEQARDKVGGMSFEAKKRMAAANAVSHGSAIIIKMSRGFVQNSDKVKDGDVVIGHWVRAHTEFNQMAFPFKSADMVISEHGGIDSYYEMLGFVDEVDCIIKKGAWYYFVNSMGETETMGNGKANSIQFLRDNPDIFAMLRAKAVAILTERYAEQEEISAEGGDE